VIPGVPVHVSQRGNRRCPVFLEDADREVFLRILKQVSALYGLLIYAYALMTNHIHLVATPLYEYSLSASMRDLLSEYATYFNRKYGLSDRLWQGQFYSALLDEPHLWAAIRYVERNPVRAGMVQRAEDYRWSSATAHCGLRTDPLLSPLPDPPVSVGEWSSWLAVDDVEQELQSIFIKDLDRQDT